MLDKGSVVTSEEAVKWVDANKGMIIMQARNYTCYTPYDVEDYVQDAYASAVEAAYCCQKNPKLIFEAVFKVVYRRMIAKVTPFPDSAREERQIKKAARQGVAESGTNKAETSRPYYSGGTSVSFPENMRKDVALDRIAEKKRSRPSVDLEKVYMQRIREHLSPKEQQVMDLAIGATAEGVLSYAEIGEKIGLKREAAKKRVTRAIDKIVERKLIYMAEAKEHMPNKSLSDQSDVPVIQERRTGVRRGPRYNLATVGEHAAAAITTYDFMCADAM